MKYGRQDIHNFAIFQMLDGCELDVIQYGGKERYHVDKKSFADSLTFLLADSTLLRMEI